MGHYRRVAKQSMVTHHYIKMASKRGVMSDANFGRSFVNDEGVPVEIPKDFTRTITLEVDGDAIESPIFEGHKRGRNWSARLDGKNGARPERAYLPMCGEIIDISGLEVGNAFAIAGDYVTSCGNFRPDRLWAVVTGKTEERLSLDVYATEARAISAARKGLRSVTITIASTGETETAA